MLRRALLASAALLALAGSAEAQQSRFQPGFNRNTFQLAGFAMLQVGGGTGAGGSTAPASSGAYNGPGDLAAADGLTAQGFWGLRAFSKAAAAAGVKAIQLIGDGTTVANTVATDVLLNADGSLNLTAAYATGGACAGGDGTCLLYIFYDQNGQVAGTTQYPQTAANKTTSPARFYKNCPSAGTGLNGSSALPCTFVAPGSVSQYAATSRAISQPVIFSSVTERTQNASSAYTVSYPMAAASGIQYNYGSSAGALSVNGGTSVNLGAILTEGKFQALSNMFYGATSGFQVNGGASFLAPSQGTTNISTSITLYSSASSGPMFGYGTEWAVYTGSWTQAQALAYNKNLSAYWNLGF